MLDLISFASVGIVVPLLMATFVIFVRMRSAKRPTSAKRIILPPFFMSTGFLMFHFPETITPLSYDMIAFCLGILFSIPLILTSKFEIVGEDVYLKRSKLFFGILLGLLIIRSIIKIWVGDSFTPLQTAGLFFILAFGIILPWRVAMLYQYRQIMKKRIMRT